MEKEWECADRKHIHVEGKSSLTGKLPLSWNLTVIYKMESHLCHSDTRFAIICSILPLHVFQFLLYSPPLYPSPEVSNLGLKLGV
jgi:hypothetical protein